MEYMCKKNYIYISILHIHTRACTCTHTYAHHCGQAPSLAWLPPSFHSSPRAAIWLADGRVRLTAEAEKRGGGNTHTHRHNQPHSYPPPPHTHTHRESLLFAVHHTSRFQLHTTIKLLTTQAASTVVNSKYDKVFLGISLRASPHFTSEESSLGYVSAKVRVPPVCY